MGGKGSGPKPKFEDEYHKRERERIQKSRGSLISKIKKDLREKHE